MSTPPQAPTPRAPAQPGTGQRSPYAGWWIASAVLVALIGVSLLWLLVSGPATSPALNAHPRTAPAAAGPSSACGLPGGDQAPPAVTPPTSWQLVGTMAAPSSATIGPGSSAGGVGTCYAPTPLGALYAAGNFLAATSTPALRTAAAQQLCAPGPGRDAALANLAAGSAGGQASGVQIAGFSFTGYTPGASAGIELAVTTGHGGWASLPLSLVFTAGTWLVQLPVTGDPYGNVQPLPSLAGFIAWSGA